MKKFAAQCLDSNDHRSYIMMDGASTECWALNVTGGAEFSVLMGRQIHRSYSIGLHPVFTVYFTLQETGTNSIEGSGPSVRQRETIIYSERQTSCKICGLC